MVIRPNLFGFDLFLSIERLARTIISNSVGTLLEKFYAYVSDSGLCIYILKSKVANCSLLCCSIQSVHALSSGSFDSFHTESDWTYIYTTVY
jgi:hypothetical protein